MGGDFDQFAHIELVGQPEYVNSNFVKGQLIARRFTLVTLEVACPVQQRLKQWQVSAEPSIAPRQVSARKAFRVMATLSS